jgi:carboxymethylenebutenolidase
MCELDQLSAMGAVNRRQFTRMGVVLGAGATIAACSTTAAEAEGGLSERMVTFNAAGGTMDGLFVHPAGKKSPAVILWPDIAGLRPAKMAMGRRLATAASPASPSPTSPRSATATGSTRSARGWPRTHPRR